MFSFLCCSTRDDSYTAEQEAAAVKIQATRRGQLGRADFAEYKAASGKGTATEELKDGTGAGATKLLMIDVIGAKGLKDVVRGMTGKKSDPFCYVEVGGVKCQTAIVKSKLAPVWNETFEIVDCPAGANVEFMVAHPAVKKSPEICLGKATIAAEDFQDGYEADVKLSDTGLKKGDAFLKVKLSWVSKVQTGKRISAFKDAPVVMWIVRYRPVGLREGPGVETKRVGVDLKPGEEFGTVEEVEGLAGQQYLRLADGRGWAFTKSAKDGEVLCEKMQAEEEVEADPAAPEEAADTKISEAAEPEAEAES